MATHPAIVTVTPGGPLEVHHVPTVSPGANQIRLLVEWTASTPLDLHQADGHLLVTPPQILGDMVAGPVVEVGSSVTTLKPGDNVFGFTYRNAAEKAHQQYCTTDVKMLGKVPNGLSMRQAVVLGDNFVTAWHTLTADFGFELPWPKKEGYQPKERDDFILIWGGSSSVGQYTLQVLKWYGYTNVIATASKQHWPRLKRYGATQCFDYRDSNVVQDIGKFISERSGQSNAGPRFVLDCIGSLDGSVTPISKIAGSGSKVAILLPVVVKDAGEGVKPEYLLDVRGVAKWQEGVDAVGVRTHFYLENAFLAAKLQSEIMPAALVQGIVEPNEQVIVEGKTMLERAEKAVSMLRRKEVSGARLVWRVADT